MNGNECFCTASVLIDRWDTLPWYQRLCWLPIILFVLLSYVIVDLPSYPTSTMGW